MDMVPAGVRLTSIWPFDFHRVLQLRASGALLPLRTGDVPRVSSCRWCLGGPLFSRWKGEVGKGLIGVGEGGMDQASQHVESSAGSK